MISKVVATVVVLVWHDAHRILEGETDPEEVLSEDSDIHASLVTTTIGYLIRSDAKGVTMAAEVQDQPENTYTYRHVSFVPRGMIVQETHAPAPRPAAKKRTRRLTPARPPVDSTG